ncbi:maltokinase [Streptomyces sp. TS71-3]|uniref:maltokinase N-terminal cap-like domain-containing protein n=1 Tax=Streptomyces sp. TS71-3 TaxID=2733862 RepID=UPI001B1976F5|nr:maltokinase [Streptomyces sp. TS71-3]GHJ36138.1 hypothetical protein Sm713_17470 [Streptomyces sp. TS71-3]
MSEAATHPGTASLACPDLLVSLGPLLHGWLPRQRWFAGKGRPVTGFSLVSATQLRPPALPAARDAGADRAAGLLHLLVRAEQPPTAGRGGPAPSGDCYQLLLGVRDTLPPHLAPALIGHVADGPLAGAGGCDGRVGRVGRVVYEALYDPQLAEVLLEALRRRARIGGLRFERDTDIEIGHGLPPRMLGAEQSNSSLVYGDTFILKLFRRIVPGTNPDLELPHALARTACPRVPPPAAWFVADARDAADARRPAPHAFAQHGPRPAAGPADGRRPGSPDRRPQPPGRYPAEPADDVLVLGVLQPFLKGAADGWELALSELARGEDFRCEARALGRATAEVHTALARALPTVTLDRRQMERLARGMTQRLDAAVDAVPALRPYARGLRSAYDSLAALGSRSDTWSAQRVHGDLHLGQCLRAPSGEWSLIDFEGEPARPLSERLMPQPPARDIAGILRSFDYAARSHRPWAPDWAHGCRGSYCAGYAEVAGHDPRAEPVLLRAYETDKAIYEVMYEARHRPDWLPVPLAAIHRLATADDL